MFEPTKMTKDAEIQIEQKPSVALCNVKSVLCALLATALLGLCTFVLIMDHNLFFPRTKTVLVEEREEIPRKVFKQYHDMQNAMKSPGQDVIFIGSSSGDVNEEMLPVVNAIIEDLDGQMKTINTKDLKSGQSSGVNVQEVIDNLFSGNFFKGLGSMPMTVEVTFLDDSLPVQRTGSEPDDGFLPLNADKVQGKNEKAIEFQALGNDQKLIEKEGNKESPVVIIQSMDQAMPLGFKNMEEIMPMIAELIPHLEDMMKSHSFVPSLDQNEHFGGNEKPVKILRAENQEMPTGFINIRDMIPKIEAIIPHIEEMMKSLSFVPSLDKNEFSGGNNKAVEMLRAMSQEMPAGFINIGDMMPSFEAIIPHMEKMLKSHSVIPSLDETNAALGDSPDDDPHNFQINFKNNSNIEFHALVNGQPMNISDLLGGNEKAVEIIHAMDQSMPEGVINIKDMLPMIGELIPHMEEMVNSLPSPDKTDVKLGSSTGVHSTHLEKNVNKDAPKGSIFLDKIVKSADKMNENLKQ